MRSVMVLCLVVSVAMGCAADSSEEPAVTASESNLEVRDDVAQRLSRYASTELEAELSAVRDEDRRVLAHLVGAARIMDEIFLRQVWSGNPELREQLSHYQGPHAEDVRTYYQVNFGPWDRLDNMEAFMGSMAHPQGAGFYPEDLTAEELETWIVEHPDSGESLRSLTTVVHRTQDGLEALPYSQAYRELLEKAAWHLREAAAASDNESLRKFLELRAEAFFSDDYYESDKAWMDLSSPVEITIGPYETYEDSLFGYKAAFEAFVTVELPKESARLDRYKEALPWLESNLPIADEHKNLGRGSESPIRVVDLVFTGGDTKAGVQTVAFNLPNDERVREEKGSKKVILRNILEAKFETILVPIAHRVLAPEQANEVSFDSFLSEVLHHELSHGLGPGRIQVDGRETEVRLELKELYSTLEEAKADVMGVFNILALLERGDMAADLLENLEPTYLAGLFRSARFGVHEAHGRGVVAQFRYLEEKGALEVDEETGLFRIVSDRFPAAMRDLLHEILMIQANGDYEQAAAFLSHYGEPAPSLLKALEKLGDVPTDIRPVYPQAHELTSEIES